MVAEDTPRPKRKPMIVGVVNGEKMPNRYLIHKTTDLETGKPLKDYHTQNPIPEGAEFEIQYEGQTLRFRMDMHFVTDEVTSVVKLVGISGGIKRPRLGG